MSDLSKTIKCAFLLLALFFVAVGASSQEVAAKAPRAVLVQAIHDFGEVVYGHKVSHEFKVRNTGNAMLEIARVNSTCNCTVVDFDAKIPPGGEGKISVVVSTETQGGPFAVLMTAVTNDPDRPRIEMSLKAEIKYRIKAKPGYVRYIVVQGFEGDSLVAQTLWPADGKPISIKQVDSPYDFVEATFREAREEEREPDIKGQQWRIETTISPDAPVGPLTGFLDVHIENSEQKLARLPLSGFVRPMIAVTPPTVDLGSFEVAEDGYRASVYVKSFTTEEIVISAAETTVEGIDAEIREDEPGRTYYVIVRVSPEAAKGDFKGLIRIKTESPKKPVVEVPLKGTVL